MLLKLKEFFQRPVIKNFSVLTASNILVQGLNVFSSIKIAKGLMPEGFGLYSFILSLSSIYVVITALGFRNVIVRGVAVNKTDSGTYFTISFLTRTLMFVVAVIAIVIYNLYFSKVNLTGWFVFWLCMNTLFALHWDTIESVTFGFEKMKYSAYINLLLTIAWVITIILLPAKYIDVYTILVVSVIQQILKTVLIAIAAFRNKMIVFTKIPGKKQILIGLKEAGPFYVLALFTLVTSSLPVVYLEHLSTYDEIAYYNIAGKLISPIQLLLFTLLSSLYPALSRNFEYDKAKFLKTIKLSFLVIFGVGVLGAVAISAFRNEIVALLYGSQYAKTADVIAISCWFTVLFGVFCLIGTILSAINKQYLLSKLSFAYAFISFPCLLYGAKFGAVGLSIGFVAAGLVNMTYHIYWVQKSIPERIENIYLYASFIVYVLLFAGSLVIVKLSFIIRILLSLLFLVALLIWGIKFLRNQQNVNKNVFVN